MSQSGKYDTSTILADIETLTGNAGGAVGPDVAGNVDIVGADGVVVTGSPASNLLTITHPAVDEVKILYVGKHGNDANDGKTIAKAKLTFQNAIDACGHDYTVVCFDDGNYTEDLAFADDEGIFAPNARIIGSHVASGVGDGNSLHFGTFQVPTGGVGLTCGAGNLRSRMLGNITLFGTAIGAVCTDGILNLNHGSRGGSYIIEDGDLVGNATTAEVNVIADIVEFTGDGNVISCSGNAIVNMSVTSICNTGVANGQLFETTGVGVPEIAATISSVNLEKLSNITAGSIVKLNAGDLNGSLAEAGAGKVSMGGASRIDNVPIGDVTPSNATFTTLNSENLTIDPGAAGDSATQYSINGTPEFIIGCDDTDDSFRIANGSALGTTDTFIMSSDGVRTMPLQSSFSAYLSGDLSNVTGDGTFFPIPFNQEYFDRNSDFDTSTGTFTAPVTAIYTFNLALGVEDITASHTNCFTVIAVNGSTYHYLSRKNFAAGQDYNNAYEENGSIIIALTAGDAVLAHIWYRNGAKVIDISSTATLTRFSGYLVC